MDSTSTKGIPSKKEENTAPSYRQRPYSPPQLPASADTPPLQITAEDVLAEMDKLHRKFMEADFQKVYTEYTKDLREEAKGSRSSEWKRHTTRPPPPTQHRRG